MHLARGLCLGAQFQIRRRPRSQITITIIEWVCTQTLGEPPRRDKRIIIWMQSRRRNDGKNIYQFRNFRPTIRFVSDRASKFHLMSKWRTKQYWKKRRIKYNRKRTKRCLWLGVSRCGGYIFCEEHDSAKIELEVCGLHRKTDKMCACLRNIYRKMQAHTSQSWPSEKQPPATLAKTMLIRCNFTILFSARGVGTHYAYAIRVATVNNIILCIFFCFCKSDSASAIHAAVIFMTIN